MRLIRLYCNIFQTVTGHYTVTSVGASLLVEHLFELFDKILELLSIILFLGPLWALSSWLRFQELPRPRSALWFRLLILAS